MYNHKKCYGSVRIAIERLTQLSTNPNHMTIKIDGMSNWTSHLPRFLVNRKSLANFFKLPSKITGAEIYSSSYPNKRKVLMYINFDQFEQGSNLIVSILYNCICNYVTEFNRLPSSLHLNLDNCWRN